MTPPDNAAGRGRFPGFDVLGQRRHWDDQTATVVLARLLPITGMSFFTPEEEAIGGVLVDQLLDLRGDTTVPVLQMIDQRLNADETDGWHYEDMPQDRQAWRDSLAYLDADARSLFERGIAECSARQQAALIQRVQDLGSRRWHGLTASRVWSLWTRYACTAFYSHPQAWNEIGFSGPAYPRGYKNPGVDAREPFEAPDVAPSDDPLRRRP